ncbi:hypothetical protein [uncultured Legionella sp.]|uniref:hypothetical protein n=1 Tax=uncultured Legionella sp. TaxID=210934 RepID=UPI00260FAB03|nr:hypothetical protein [uncultured Legionella sp.]
MHSGKLLYTLFKEKIVATAQKAGEKLSNLENPNVGSPLIKLQRPTLLVRVDTRSHIDFHRLNGLVARNTEEEIMSIRFSDVEAYQKYNTNKFAWGACRNMTELEFFLDNNKDHTEGAWIHMFYGDATCLSTLKIDTGISPDGLDSESEQLVLKDLPFKHWLASTCPQYRSKFLDGGMVPNAMVEFNKDLPRTLRRQDLATERNTLRWLLMNNSEEIFSDLCQHLYTGMSSEGLDRRFEHDTAIVDAIEYFLRMSHSTEPKM